MQYIRLDIQWGAAGEYWHLAGGFNKNAEKQFLALASIAGDKLSGILSPGIDVVNEVLSESNPVYRWYKGVWKISGNFEFGFVGEQKTDKDESAGFIYTGTINSIAEASATFCIELRAKYPDKEPKKTTPAIAEQIAVNKYKVNRLDDLILKGEYVLKSIGEIGNIDKHDLWFTEAKNFLLVNAPEFSNKLLSVAPKYSAALIDNPHGRAAYNCIQEQLEVLKATRALFLNTPEVDHTERETSGLLSTIEMKPGFFGFSIDIKKLWKWFERHVLKRT